MYVCQSEDIPLSSGLSDLCVVYSYVTDPQRTSAHNDEWAAYESRISPKTKITEHT